MNAGGPFTVTVASHRAVPSGPTSVATPAMPNPTSVAPSPSRCTDPTAGSRPAGAVCGCRRAGDGRSAGCAPGPGRPANVAAYAVLGDDGGLRVVLINEEETDS